jgi:hypothetical protein
MIVQTEWKFVVNSEKIRLKDNTVQSTVENRTYEFNSVVCSVYWTSQRGEVKFISIGSVTMSGLQKTN